MLLNNATRLILGTLEESSQSAYAVGQRRFVKFATEYQLKLGQLFPLSRSVLLGFATWLFSDPRRLMYQTIKSYLCHVRHLASSLGFDGDAFGCPRLQMLMRSIRKSRRAKARVTRLPITIALLNKFAEILDAEDYSACLVLAALSVGVYGLMRSGELAVKSRTDKMEPENLLTRSAITWENNKFTVHLAVSKTDPFRQGTDITIYSNDSATCPYRALRKVWNRAPIQLPSAPLFQHLDGTALHYSQLNVAIKNLAATLGLNPRSFTGHSMRIGGATSLAMRGYSQNVIQALGRWQSLSVQLYTRLVGGMRQQVAAALARPLPVDRNSLFGGVDPSLACKLTADGFYNALAKKPSPGVDLHY